MLEEGRRLRAEGHDVAVAVVETHGRAATASMAEGLEILPRVRVEHRGVLLADLDLDGMLARRPEYALVDELAHTNAPGLRHAKRWQDVQALLDAGINVLSTVNIQHIEKVLKALAIQHPDRRYQLDDMHLYVIAIPVQIGRASCRERV